MSAKMGENGGDKKTRALIAAWGKRRILYKIDKSHRNADVYADIPKAVKKHGLSSGEKSPPNI